MSRLYSTKVAYTAIVLGTFFLSFTACKKTDVPAPAPITIASESTFAHLALDAQEEPSYFFASFSYYNVVYHVQARRVRPGTQNGSIRFVQSQLVSPASVLDPKTHDVIGVRNPTLSGEVICTIDSFITVYGTTGVGSYGVRDQPVDIRFFNKIRLVLKPNMECYVEGGRDFPARYGTDASALSQATVKATNLFSDYDPATTNDQSLPLSIYVYRDAWW